MTSLMHGSVEFISPPRRLFKRYGVHKRKHPPLQRLVSLPHGHLDDGVAHVGHDERAKHHPVEEAEPRQHKGEQHPSAELRASEGGRSRESGGGWRGAGGRGGGDPTSVKRGVESKSKKRRDAYVSGVKQATLFLFVRISGGIPENTTFRSYDTSSSNTSTHVSSSWRETPQA